MASMVLKFWMKLQGGGSSYTPTSGTYNFVPSGNDSFVSSDSLTFTVNH